MNQEQLRERIHAGIDRHCAPLIADPYRVQRVLNAAQREGEQVVKKKLSVSLVLVMVIVLFTAAALAVVTIRETGRLFAQTEQENGDYVDWPAEKKAMVVSALIEEGYIKETTERKQLREGTLTQKDAARIADEAIAEFTGENAQHATFLSVMSAAWGSFEQWSQEQKAWYSQVMADTGAQMDGMTYYVENAGSLSEQEAIAIAKKEIAHGFELDEKLLDKYRVYDVNLQIPEFAESGDTKAYWYIAMDTMQTELEGQEGLPFQTIDVFVDPETGELLEPIEEKVAAFKAAQEQQSHPLALAIREFEASINEPKAFHTWSVANKARWSQEIAPQLKAYMETNGDSASLVQDDEMKLSIAYTYGLPDEKAISQERAMTVVREALRAEYNLSDEEMSLLFDNGLSFDEPAVFYDVTDSAHPQWKLLFTMPSIYCADDDIASRVKALYGTDVAHNQFYMAEINAYTETVSRTFAASSLPDMLKAF